jgi:hypothetical protein
MKYISFIVCATLLLSSCLYSNLEEMYPQEEVCITDTVDVTYTKDILPLLTDNCGTNNTCHQTSGNLSDVPLDTYADLNNVVVTGQLLSSVLHDGNAAEMPKGQAKLKDCQINKVKAWINQGARE